MKQILPIYIFSFLSILIITNCGDSDLAENQVLDAVGITINGPSKINQGTEVDFKINATGNPDIYEWSFPGGIPENSTEVNPKVIFNEYGIYEILLTVTRSVDGQTATAVSEMIVCINDGLLAYYPMDGDAVDEGPNGFHGKVNGATPTTGVSGDSDSAMNFDGSDDYIETSNMIDELFENGVTFSVWVNLGTSGINSRILANYNGAAAGGNCGGRNGFLLGTTEKDEIRFLHYTDGNDYTGKITSENILNVGQWHHIAATWDGTETSDAFELYVDGIRADIRNFEDGGTCAFRESEQAIDFGRTICGTGPCRFYNGGIDESRIYNRPLNADEISFLAK